MNVYMIIFSIYITVFITDYIYLKGNLSKREKTIYFLLNTIVFIIFFMISINVNLPKPTKLIEYVVKKIVNRK